MSMDSGDGSFVGSCFFRIVRFVLIVALIVGVRLLFRALFRGF